MSQRKLPIKHPRKPVAARPRYVGFADFGDAGAYRAEVDASNEKMRNRRGE